MYICMTCNSDTRAYDQCLQHVRFKQVIKHGILCVTLREQLHSMLSADKKNQDATFTNQQITFHLTVKHCMERFFLPGLDVRCLS